MTETKPETKDVAPPQWTPEQVALLKRTVAKGATDDELRLFAYVCRKNGLDPFLKQIHAVKRWSAEAQREEMVIQTGIDGLRLIAERTGRYAPGREPAFTYAEDGTLVSATSFVKKQTLDGTWHEVAATALVSEYAQRKRSGELTAFWKRMPHGQTAKCAEALALRRAFPQETSGLVTHEEMAQADPAPAEDASREPAFSTTSVEFRGAVYSTAGITQDTFDKVQLLCKRVGKDCATHLLGTLDVGGVFELSEETGQRYLQKLEAAAEGLDSQPFLGREPGDL